jgi:DNA-binding NarL/FixJ family response regulator
MTTVRIAIIEDNPTLRQSWAEYLATNPLIEDVATFHTAEEALASRDLAKMDLVLLDIELPGKSGIETIPALLARNPRLLVVIISVHHDDEYILEALKKGAIGYLNKNVGPVDLLESIKSALSGGSPLSPNIASRLVRFFQAVKSGMEPLSDRELDILKLLVDGYSYKSIAERTFLSVDGVRYHIRNIYYKLQVNSKSQAVAKAYRDRLV